jgi:subtilisin family serine protease
LTVPNAKVAATEAALRTQSGVQSIAITGGRRAPTSASASWTTDPYFNGFTTTVSTGGVTPAATYHVGPYEESDTVPGQWDMHAIGLEKAFGYSSLTTNTAGKAVTAMGSSAIKIAIIDTGEDATHPELAGKIAYQKCFITNAAGTAQSSGSFAVDEDGHGTDVAGIAAEATNNSFGFTSAGGNSTIYAYRVFPTPDDNCTNPDSTDPQCEADTADIASAINDAVAENVNVISMSLGGSECGTGSGYAANGDSDAMEGAAVANAIAAGIVVVAASGNASGQGVAAPACDTSVIAVGASALDDGNPNASSASLGGTSAAPVEYVATYSQYGSPGTAVNVPTAWGIVAPGGDPTTSEESGTVYDLHWIENIWTSTPYESSASDSSFLGECSPDYGTTSQNDCRTLIAGTSMATPHVAGAAALIIAVAPQYGTPAAMKTLLCETADDINSPIEGCGRLDIYKAMAKAVGDSSP